ncbi:MAG TPA: EamA family transporter RarD [Spirochaetia bacterium]|jgi:chloramphenicol-sensitive protein RarD|nr:EamA family transporter RarD [Spirochaetia bacterium]
MTDSRRGTTLAALSYALWGLLPLYWKALEAVGPGAVLAHRILWALVFTTVLVLALRIVPEVRSLFTSGKKILFMVGASLLISANWGLYIWAIDAGHLVESALGYYINPLVSVLLGILFLKEKLTRIQTLAFVLAAAGVAVMALGIGRIPFVALGLALTFGFYGLMKKQAPVSALASLQVETLFSLPLAVVLLVPAPGFFGVAQPTWTEVILLVLAGPVTALPLWLFGTGARLIPLTRIGFLQYISPTINLALGLFVFHESFGTWQGLAFGCIWTALVLFTWDSLRRRATP